jgi:hypothetical protein
VVVDVIDGDTIDVQLPDGRVDRVRLIGINAPEGGECWSTEAAEELERLVAGEAVVLVEDESDRDQYDRLLRYVEQDDADVGARLVRDGFAVVRVRACAPAPRTSPPSSRSAPRPTSQRPTWPGESPSGCGSCATGLHRRLADRFAGRLVLNGHPTMRLPNTVNVSLPPPAEAILTTASGLAASTGSACHAGDPRPSPVLTAMGVPDDVALSAVRLSLGRLSTMDDVERAYADLAAASQQLGGRR